VSAARIVKMLKVMGKSALLSRNFGFQHVIFHQEGRTGQGSAQVP